MLDTGDDMIETGVGASDAARDEETIIDVRVAILDVIGRAEGNAIEAIFELNDRVPEVDSTLDI